MSELFANVKSTAVAKYQGISVAELQELRKNAREAGVVIKVVKNRLVRVAMSKSSTYESTDTVALTGQLLYAVSQDDSSLLIYSLIKRFFHTMQWSIS